MKKIVIALLCFCFFMVGCNYTSPSPESNQNERVVMGDFVLAKSSKHSGFSVFSDAYYLHSYTGNDREVTLPRTAPDGIPILAVDVWAFNECETVEKIVVPDGYTAILPWAFQSCVNLKEILVGKDVVDFSDCEVFAFCNQLSIIDVDSENVAYQSKGNCILTKDGTVLIAGCKNSRIPDTVIKIGVNAFCNIESLQSILIPDHVQTIGAFAFSGCAGLSKIEIPQTVSVVEYFAFGNCANLTVYCQATEKPESWHQFWDGSNSKRYPTPTVIWETA